MREVHPNIHSLFVERWSPRSFSEQPVSTEVLRSVFEAARWAPSGGNAQPWRFVVATTPEEKERFCSFINPGNLRWCVTAPVLVLLLSKTTNGQGKPHRSHAFDAGAAWSHLALQATHAGLVTHAMGGFDAGKAREVLSIPPEYEPQVVIALGYQGEKDRLPEDLQTRETPSDRLPLKDLVIRGRFPNK